MEKAHEVKDVQLSGTIMTLRVDGRQYEVDITKHSTLLTKATPEQRGNFEVSPVGYGIHWPDLDEDLSIDCLIGVKHACPLIKSNH